MDPALKELIAAGNPEEQIEAIIRQDPRMKILPPQVKVIAEFDDIKTVRVKRRDIESVWAHPGTASVKAARILQFEERNAFFNHATAAQRIQRPAIGSKGNGVVVGVVDWGFDFAHPAFLDTRGQTRIEALWDQRGERSHRSPRYGYGKVLQARDLNAALQTVKPYRHVNYHPGDADTGIGAHGTHVADIAAGSHSTFSGGIAPEAALVFVHLASQPLTGLANLGDSVRLLEAIQFIAEVAGDRPLVINLSVGRHGGPHTGLTLVEQAFDRFLEGAPNRLIVQSAGNYFQAKTHTQNRLLPGGEISLQWQVNPGDRTPNELELWYSDRDNFDVFVTPPNGDSAITVKRGDSRSLYGRNGEEVGRLYHRAYDPNTPDHHFEAFLKPNAPPGIWTLTVKGKQVEDGRFHAWIERDGRGKRQSRFANSNVKTSNTVGSICNGFLPIAVGAADWTPFGVSPAPFASAGPTRDGRQKPDLSAPGVRIRAAKSTPRWSSRPRPGSTVMSGASQASPYVAGVAAAMLSGESTPLNIHEIRAKITSLIIPHPQEDSGNLSPQLGAGVIEANALQNMHIIN